MIGGKKLILIAAMDRLKAIGLKGDLPWHIPSDLKFFKAQTMGKTMVMGRKTFESIGRPLPGRTTLILSRTGYRGDGCATVSSLAEAAALTKGRDLMVVGGGEIYRLALEHADELILTHVDILVEGDAFFPSYSDDFTCVSRDETIDQKTGFSLSFARYQRNTVTPNR